MSARGQAGSHYRTGPWTKTGLFTIPGGTAIDSALVDLPMESLLRDVRMAIRGLRRSPSFSVVAVLTLALGIGATTSVFSVVYAVLFRPLPFPNADRLVQIVQTMTSRGSDESFRAGLTPDQLANLQDYSTTLEAAGVFGHAWLTLTGVSVPAVLSGSTVTVGVLDGLGVAPLLGRALREEDALPGAEPVLVLSESTWRRYFGAREDLVGQRIAFDDLHRRVVGVMPASFRFPSLAGPGISRNSLGDLAEAPEFWLPGPSFTRTGPATGFTILQAWALLKPGVSLEQAAAEIRSLAGTLPDGRRVPIEVTSARDEIGLPARRVLLIFQTGVSLILVIACVNVINLLLTRMAGRRHELALRVALGASRGRIAREGMTEALLLAVSGGAVGCLFAYALTDVLQSLPPHTLPRLRDIRVDTVVLGFALLVSIATGLGVGALSALRLGGADSSGGLHLRPAPGTTRQRRLRPSSVLVVLEISAAMVLAHSIRSPRQQLHPSRAR